MKLEWGKLRRAQQGVLYGWARGKHYDVSGSATFIIYGLMKSVPANIGLKSSTQNLAVALVGYS